jgi:TolA protein
MVTYPRGKTTLRTRLHPGLNHRKGEYRIDADILCARSVAVLTTALKNLASLAQTARQPGTAPQVFDYPEMVRQRVRANIVWGGKAGRQETMLEVHCAPSGNLESVKIIRSSGDRAWDKAALEAVRRSDPMPLEESGQAPRSFTITLKPGI